MGKSKPIPAEAFAPGCRLDFRNNRLYGADGKVYDNVEVKRQDVERLLQELRGQNERAKN
jgi:hypothetical protein